MFMKYCLHYLSSDMISVNDLVLFLQTTLLFETTLLYYSVFYFKLSYPGWSFCDIFVYLLLGSRSDNRIHLCGFHLHFCCISFLLVLSAAKELHRRCKMCDLFLFVELLFCNRHFVQQLLNYCWHTHWFIGHFLT